MAWLYPWNLRVRPVLHSVDGMLNILQRVIAATHRIEPRLCVLKRIQERGVSQPFIPLQGPSSGLSTSDIHVMFIFPAPVGRPETRNASGTDEWWSEREEVTGALGLSFWFPTFQRAHPRGPN